MNLEEMGQILRQERERQGLTLEKAAADIKISKKYLVALESGNKDELPHPVYAKGFLKNYARLLGLDPTQFGDILDIHHAVEDDHMREMPRYEIKDSSPSIRDRLSGSGFRPPLWLAVPVVLAFAGLVWFFFFSGPAKPDFIGSVARFFTPSAQSPAPEPAPAPKAAAPAKSEAKPEPAPAKSEAKAPPAEPSQPEASQPVQRDILATSPVTGPRTATPPAQATENPAARMAAESQFGAVGNQILEINATQPCKLEVTDESGQSRNFSLLKGQRLALRFNDKAVVRFVSAPAVAVKLNGKDYPLDGGKVEGRSVQFP